MIVQLETWRLKLGIYVEKCWGGCWLNENGNVALSFPVVFQTQTIALGDLLILPAESQTIMREKPTNTCKPKEHDSFFVRTRSYSTHYRKIETYNGLDIRCRTNLGELRSWSTYRSSRSTSSDHTDCLRGVRWTYYLVSPDS